MIISLKSFFIILIINLITFCNANANSIISSVNNDIITYYDFESRKNFILLLNSIKLSNKENLADLDQSVFYNLVNSALLMQEFNHENYQISKEDLDNTINDFLIDLGINNLEHFYALLSKNNIDKNVFEKYIKDEFIKLYFFTKIQKNTHLTEDEINIYLSEDFYKDSNCIDTIVVSSSNYNILKKTRNKLIQNFSNIEKLFNNNKKNISVKKISGSIQNFSNIEKLVLYYLSPGEVSYIIENAKQYKLIVLNKKECSLIQNADYQNLIMKIFLKKIDTNMSKLYNDLYKGSTIKILDY